MDADDFQDLYNLLRGSRCAMTVLDARALFVDKKIEDALQKLIEARESFAESRYRVLKQDPEKHIDPKAKDRDRQLRKATRKQEKALETLGAFDELMPALEKMVERDRVRRQRQAAQIEKKRSPEESPTSENAGLDSCSDFDSLGEGPLPQESSETQSQQSQTQQRLACMADFTDAVLSEFAKCKGDEKLDLIGKCFGFRPVKDDQDVIDGGVYLIQTSKRILLVCLPESGSSNPELPLLNLVDKKRIKPITKASFVNLGTHRKMVLLTCSESEESKEVDLASSASTEEKNQGEIKDSGTTVDEVGTVVEERVPAASDQAASDQTVNEQVVGDTVVED